MKKHFSLFIPAVIVVLFLSGCVDKPSQSGGGMAYDQFKGDQSSIVNMVQYEALSKCFDQFHLWDFGETIHYEINSGNQQVYDQVQMLLNTKIIDNNISIADENEVESDNYKIKLQINVICGGYYFTDGIILKKFSSITRVMIIRKDMETGKSLYFDSDYQSYRYYTPDFTEIFKVFIYALLFVGIMLFVYFLFFKKKESVRKDTKVVRSKPKASKKTR